MIDRAKYLDAILDITGSDSWEIVREVWKEDVANVEAQELQAETWDNVLELRGFRRCLIYIRDIRNLAKLEKHNAV